MLRRVTYLLLAAALLTAAGAQGGQMEPTTLQLQELRDMLLRYEQVENAEADGYEVFGACMSNEQGAQGVHYVNNALLADPSVDVMRPEALMYEPREDGTLRLVGMELLVFQDEWHAAGNEPVPVQLGREFGINMTLLDRPFYALHVWALQHNPSGFHANWNPLVSCEHAAEAAPEAAH